MIKFSIKAIKSLKKAQTAQVSRYVDPSVAQFTLEINSKNQSKHPLGRPANDQTEF